MDPNTAECVTAYGTVALAAATFLVALVAAFQDLIRRWLIKPQLQVFFINRPPHCQKITARIERVPKSVQLLVQLPAPPPTAEKQPVQMRDEEEKIEGYYFRLCVRNNGNTAAELVEVCASELRKKGQDDVFTRIDNFLPMNFRWCHTQEFKGLKGVLRTLAPKMERHCDLGHIFHPGQREKLYLEDKPEQESTKGKTVFCLDLEMQSLTLGHLIEPGKYQLDILVAAANIRNPLKKTLEISFDGKWFDEDSKMFQDGIGIKFI